MGQVMLERILPRENQVVYTQFQDAFSAGELLIELFQYFTACELFTSFYNLNTRLNSIIEQDTPLHLNSYLSPKNWNQLVEELLPKINPYQLKSLTLEHSSLREQIDLRAYVDGLRVLILQDANNLTLIIALFPHLHQLRRLTVFHRFFETIHAPSVAEEVQFFAQLPSTLTHLTVSEVVISPPVGALVLPGARLPHVTTSLKHLKLHRSTTATFLSLIPVFQSALSIEITDVPWIDHQKHVVELSNITVFPKLVNFAVNFDRILHLHFEHLKTILERMPYLKNLSISVLYSKAAFVSNGEQWSRLLDLYCPALAKFDLKLCPNGMRQNITEPEINSFKIIEEQLGPRLECKRGSTYPDGSYDFDIAARVAY